MASPTRVLWLIKGLGAGGAERLLVSAARVGNHRAFRYEAAYVLPEKDALVRELESYGVVSHCLSAKRSPWPMALRHLLMTGEYDVVHLHSPLVAGVARIVVRTLPKRRRPFLVSTEHNTWDSYSLPTRLLNASLYFSDRHRWAVSPRVRASVWRPLRAGVRVLIHGIVMQDVKPPTDRDALRAELGASPDDVVAATVANFRPEKAYSDLLVAASIALPAEPHLRLIIVGQGPLENEIRRQHGALGLGDRCRILGYRDDVMHLLSACDLFILASRFEGFPIALMEAMATGLPVVATAVGGIPEAVRHGKEGLLTSPGDPVALADAVVELVIDSERRLAMAEAALTRGRQFDVRSAVRTCESAYSELVSEHPSR